MASPNDDIRHAGNNAVLAFNDPNQPDLTMLIGPDEAVRMIEVGILNADDNDYAIHAMQARPKYLNMIDTTRGDP